MCDVDGIVFGMVIIGIDGKYIVILELGKVLVNEIIIVVVKNVIGKES